MEIRLGRGPKNVSSPSISSINKRTVDVKLDAVVAEQIKQYTLSDTSRELGGILLGTCIEKKGCYYIQIKAAIEARYTEAGQSSLTFTHESWDYMNKEKEKCYPQYKVMGWFHSHPDFGIFLSSHDIFIQKNFFDLPWLVAYVVDPLGDKAGLFGWQNADLVGLPFTVGGVNYPAANKQQSIDDSVFNTPGNMTQRVLSVLLIFSVAALGFAFWSFSKNPSHTLPLLPDLKYFSVASIIEFLINLFWQIVKEIQDLLGSLKSTDFMFLEKLI